MSESDGVLDESLRLFVNALQSTLNERVHVSLRYIAGRGEDGLTTWSVVLTFLPDPIPPERCVVLTVPGMEAGEIAAEVTLDEAVELGRAAASGTITLGGAKLRMPGTSQPHLSSRFVDIDRGIVSPQLSIVGGATPLEPLTVASIGGLLRSANTPFDGLDDLAAWLDIPTPRPGRQATATLHIRPTADLVDDQCTLTEGRLTVRVRAHPATRRERIRVAVRVSPSEGPVRRFQIAELLEWSDQSSPSVGTAILEVPSSARALVLLSMGATLWRRRWIVDGSRTENQRLAMVQAFDANLKEVRKGLKGSDANRFERAVAGVLFLRGLSPMLQLETDAPDVVAFSPGGRAIIVECTIGAKDAATKVGKLVDRRATLTSSDSQASLRAEDVVALLVTGQSREQAKVVASECEKHSIAMLTAEELRDELDSAQVISSADEWYDRVVSRATGAAAGEEVPRAT